MGELSTDRCNDCGRFMQLCNGASSATMYDMVGMQPSHDHWRCPSCTKTLGPIESNARPANGDMSPYQCVHD